MFFYFTSENIWILFQFIVKEQMNCEEHSIIDPTFQCFFSHIFYKFKICCVLFLNQISCSTAAPILCFWPTARPRVSGLQHDHVSLAYSTTTCLWPTSRPRVSGLHHDHVSLAYSTTTCFWPIARPRVSGQQHDHVSLAYIMTTCFWPTSRVLFL